MGLSRGSKELLQQSVYLLAKVLVFIMLLRTKNQCWYLFVSFPQLCYHYQWLRQVPQQKQKIGLPTCPQVNRLKQQYCGVIFSSCLQLAFAWKSGGHLPALVLACTAHFLHCPAFLRKHQKSSFEISQDRTSVCVISVGKITAESFQKAR